MVKPDCMMTSTHGSRCIIAEHVHLGGLNRERIAVRANASMVHSPCQRTPPGCNSVSSMLVQLGIQN